ERGDATDAVEVEDDRSAAGGQRRHAGGAVERLVEDAGDLDPADPGAADLLHLETRLSRHRASVTASPAPSPAGASIRVYAGRARSGELGQVRVDLGQLEAVGVVVAQELARFPGRPAAAARPGQELVVAVDAAGVLRRAGALAAGALGERLAAGRGRDSVHLDVVDPVVAEIIGVREAAARADQRVQPDAALVLLRLDPERAVVRGGPEAAVADLELVQVVVLPAHRALDHLVQAGQGDRPGHAHAPPDRRPGARDGDAELVGGAARLADQAERGGVRVGVVLERRHPHPVDVAAGVDREGQLVHVRLGGVAREPRGAGAQRRDRAARVQLGERADDVI